MGFNIQLDTDGSSGSASWPDDKNVTGTFTLKGDKLEVEMTRPHQDVGNSSDRFILNMTVNPDGSLTGTMEYHGHSSDPQGNIEPYVEQTPATGERR